MNMRARNAAIAQGGMFLSGFGSVWLLWGLADAFPSHYSSLIVASAIGVSLFIASWQAVKFNQGMAGVPSESQSVARIRRQFRRINIAQWVAVIFTVVVLLLIKRSELIPRAIVVIVGIHFLPLGFLFRNGAHLVTGVVLVVVACTSFLLSRYVEPSAGAAIGAGVILLVSAAYALATIVFSRKESEVHGVARGNG